ncbi:hypothetical protein [Aeromonas salmonicida]|uniref:Apea-like HEPN domain-containing protein n=1 Tax=Aeromonas salmonicida TaxID=645 RepID=A0AAX3VUG6_AERSA|nr:hypothetical protein [Aeromonas salmonicida]WHF37099.1 hypothetical protein QLQ87_01660 [Aeromonas salmonicida]
MNNDDQRKRQDFLNAIRDYPYITDEGHLVLEPFCVNLSDCFEFDGVLDKCPHPYDIYMLLIDLIRDHFGDETAKQYVKFKNILDWSPDMASLYPERRMTFIHPVALLNVSHYWIYDIGHSLIQIPESAELSGYFDWVDKEWIAVYGFINGYHNTWYSFQKEFDRKNIQSIGYSHFEALHLAKYRNIDFDAAIETLKARHASYQAALARIETAIKNGYFLEAISLEECLISNCLYNYLSNTGSTLNNPSFNFLLIEILKDVRSFDKSSILLFKAIDVWRANRNKSIHGFITANSDTLSQSHQSFQRLTETTAKEGKALCESIVSWYELECVNFIPHQISSRVTTH